MDSRTPAHRVKAGVEVRQAFSQKLAARVVDNHLLSVGHLSRQFRIEIVPSPQVARFERRVENPPLESDASENQS